MKDKVKQIIQKYEAVTEQLAKPEIASDPDRYRELAKEHHDLNPVAKKGSEYINITDQIDEDEAILKSDDEELKELVQEEIEGLRNEALKLEEELKVLLLLKDPLDEKNTIMEIRAGTGGEEAALFAADLYRMYGHFAEQNGWDIKLIAANVTGNGGYKEVIARIEGKDVYGQLKFESGAHRVQRVPQTESQGRIHTSACTVAVMPEVEDLDEIEINKNDLRVDTFRASGAGGQHVNKTDSAIRLTHLPTGIVVECQDERSQHKNKARAMSLLQAKLLDQAQKALQQEESDTRRKLVGSGDRSEKIRTYNYPQGRVTDHRIKLTLYSLEEIMSGELALVVQPLINEYQADLLIGLSEEE